MGLIDSFFGKPKPIITEEDNKELRDLQRKAYMEEAKKLIEERGKERARQELGQKQKKESVF